MDDELANRYSLKKEPAHVQQVTASATGNCNTGYQPISLWTAMHNSLRPLQQGTLFGPVGQRYHSQLGKMQLSSAKVWN
jgi:hypothetical protein